MKNISYQAILLGVLLLAVEGSRLDSVLSRWRRQVHCQPDDEACQRCSSSCSSVGTSHLPECCEAYNTCCDEYFQACKQCSSVASKDRYFPEYCCASFTDCCDLITTFTTQVKSPNPVRPSKPKSDLKIPDVAAPKPSTFPGSKSVFSARAQDSLTLRQNEFAESGFIQDPNFAAQDSIFASQNPLHEVQTAGNRQRRPSTFAAQSQGSAKPQDSDVPQRQVARTQARAQVRPQTSSKLQSTRRPQIQDEVDLSSRRGRVTSRGRVAA
ncbi:hypothetical protein SK128_015416 [Halocaridina rubra]|uniref:SMB domain-containing protein n=1 Tax=Halocaridina rubra TaxID=373956 RepID=A0AAN8WVJ0_HALRR